ncbi:solute carrier organic anion transporter family member 3A1-like [Ptychodera flava]|uniref:solute carrier organic anion transporter family member 3A1-like n=1 Tax=Ptychodera flava TaxID=63121 RepID=UPI003969EF1C
MGNNEEVHRKLKSANGLDKRRDSLTSYTKIEEDEINLDDFRCGYFKCKPNCIQCLGNPKSFVVFLVLSSILSLCISAGYLAGILSTIEKRYQLPSSLSGTLLMFNEIGSLTTILFVTYFGSKGHRPRIIGSGAVLVGIGAILSAMPQFISPPLEIPSPDYRNGSQEAPDGMCIPGQNATNGEDTCGDEEDNLVGKVNLSSLLLFIIGQFVIGAGNTPFIPLGTTYIDDGVRQHETALYLAVIYASLLIGPTFGFILCARTLSKYVDFYRVDESLLSSLTPNDPRWVGAWWIGFLFGGILLIFASIPLFGFPKRPRSRHALMIYKQKLLTAKRTDKSGKNSNMKEKMKGFPRALCRLFTNVPLMAACLGLCAEMAVVAGFAAFFPKYLQLQFGIPAGRASMLMGLMILPGGITGMLLGGFIVRKYKLTPKGCARMVAILSAIKTVAYLTIFIFKCDNANIAGIFVPYSDQVADPQSVLHPVSSCNIDCACSFDIYEPVCGVDGNTYLSHCYAGCKDVTMTTIIGPTGMPFKNFTDCSCVPIGHPDNTSAVTPGFALSTPCQTDCAYLWPTLAVVCAGFLIGTMAQNPSVLFIIRSVAEEDRSLAMGVNIVIMRVLGFIPAPIIFGMVIDSSCVLWNESCGHSGACLVYDMVRYRYVYVGLAAVFMAVGVVCFFVAMKTVKTEYKPREWKEMEEKVGTRLGETLAMSIENIAAAEYEQHTSNGIVQHSRTPEVDLENDKSSSEYFL